jgi:hypothetical protein
MITAYYKISIFIVPGESATKSDFKKWPSRITSKNGNNTQKHLVTYIKKKYLITIRSIFQKHPRRKHHVINILSTQYPLQNNFYAWG